MFGAFRFWLNKGVAGFRLDAVPTLFEDQQLRDEKVLPGTNAYGDPNLDDSLTNNLPEVHQVMRALRKVTNSYPGQPCSDRRNLPAGYRGAAQVVWREPRRIATAHGYAGGLPQQARCSGLSQPH